MRYRTVIDFDAKSEDIAEITASLAFLHLRLVLTNHVDEGDPGSATFHGVRAMTKDPAEAGLKANEDQGDGEQLDHPTLPL